MHKKGPSLLIITFIYLIASAAGFTLFSQLDSVLPEIWALLWADVVATIIVWAFGLLYKNVSVYDPYWSVFPPVAFTAWTIYKATFSLPIILLLIAVWYWGFRLTGNWVITFKGLDYEDWRYTRYRETQRPVLFHFINFFGLNIMPTLVVFGAMLPGLGLFESTTSTHPLTWLGFTMCLASATIQLVADTQIHRFRDSHPGQYCNVGLWRHGRHPNYFGEIMMWWGVWVMYASLNGFNWLILGPVAMTALFLCISIPMMERRQLQNKPGYAEYKKSTRRLI